MMEYGTQILINILDQTGALPVNNFRDSGTFPQADATSGETLAKTYLVRNKGCMGCAIGCGRIVNVRDGPFKGFGEGPEYEAGWSYGADCGVDNLAAIIKANNYCNELGLDPITMGSTIACAMELFEIGAISEKETAALCALGRTAPNPVLSTLQYFRDEYLAHIVDHRCPAGICKELTEFYIDPELCTGCGRCRRNCPADAVAGGGTLHTEGRGRRIYLPATKRLPWWRGTVAGGDDKRCMEKILVTGKVLDELRRITKKVYNKGEVA